jgi:hypothetical protein
LGGGVGVAAWLASGLTAAEVAAVGGEGAAGLGRWPAGLAGASSSGGAEAALLVGGAHGAVVSSVMVNGSAGPGWA